jgi:hypothetical protein
MSNAGTAILGTAILTGAVSPFLIWTLQTMLELAGDLE